MVALQEACPEPTTCLSAHLPLAFVSHSAPTQDGPRKLPKGPTQVRLQKLSVPMQPSPSVPARTAALRGPLKPAHCPFCSLERHGGVLVLHPRPPACAATRSSLALGLRQEPRLSLGGQHCVGEPDEELAGAFPLFIRNAVLGQKQPKRARVEPRRSTDAVSASHGGQASPQPTACRSALPFPSGQNRLRWPRRPDQVHPACILFCGLG